MAPVIDKLKVSAFKVPTDAPESDGTLQWDSTTMVLVELSAGDQTGIGYTYASSSLVVLIKEKLAEIVLGQNPHDVKRLWHEQRRALRNLGTEGICATAVSCVDMAIWDLKARLIDASMLDVLGAARDGIDVYGSGGFTSYNDEQLRTQLGGWARQGIKRVKMKVGRNPSADLARAASARDAIGPDVELFVDANGGYDVKQAVFFAEAYHREFDVRWFEEPVTSDDLPGLRMVRERAPGGLEIAAGEYGYSSFYFEAMLDAGAVDVLQVDATRAGGVTGFLLADALCQSRHRPLSAHTAPSLHSWLCCAALTARHLEYFHDHVRIEQMFFHGAAKPAADGRIYPDRSAKGFGLSLNEDAAACFLVASDEAFSRARTARTAS